jgi:hypothetical protein
MFHVLNAARAQIGDPHPVWVTDEYERTDVQPGCVLQLRMAQRDYFMIISQYAQGTFIERYYESGDEGPGTFYPQGKDSDDWRRALRQVAAGIDKNQVFLGYRIYGYRFVPVLDERAILEVVGDWKDVITAAMADNDARFVVWKSGLLAHAQTHPELGDDDSYGGYGYLGEPHSHFLGVGDAPILSNLDPGDPDYETPVPLKHRHGYMFGAATLPKVRPVLLCQKI